MTVSRFLSVVTLLSTSTDGLSFLPGCSRHRSSPVSLNVVKKTDSNSPLERGESVLGKVGAAALSLVILTTGSPAFADGQTKDFKLPPIDFNNKERCTLNSSKMGQANAARDSLYDLRMCDLSGKDATGYDLSGVIMSKTDLTGTKFQEAQFSKAYLHDSKFDGADFTNGIVDRASFRGSSLRGTLFVNSVLSGTSFEGADVENADFSEAAMGSFDIKNLCKNPTLKGENPKTGMDTRDSVGCGPS